MMVLVTGGSGSGKSAYAEDLILRMEGERRVYVASMQPWDEECLKRIEKHRKMRAYKGFETIECYENPERLRLAGEPVVLLECLSNVLSNMMFAPSACQEDAGERLCQGLLSLSAQASSLVIVSNEVFADGCDYDPSTAAYMRILGQVNRRMGAEADCVVRVVAGIPVIIKKKAGINVELKAGKEV